MNRKTKGNIGEAIAKNYYEGLGFEILETNYRHRRAEVDIIGILDEQLLVFVEVKWRGNSDFGEAETFVSRGQENRIKDAAEDYILAIDWKKDIRFDIVCIDGKGTIEVFEDAF